MKYQIDPVMLYLSYTRLFKDEKDGIPEYSIEEYRNTDKQLTNRLLHGPPSFIYLIGRDAGFQIYRPTDL